MTYVDLSHYFEDNMPGFKLKNEDGTYTQYTAKIRPFLTHEQSKPKFNGLCSFEITEISFQTSTGTYIDSPYHRYPNGKDISEISLDNLIAPGVLIDVRNRQPNESISIDVLPKGLELEGKAILFNFGYDQHWGSDYYYSYPFLSEHIIDTLIEKKIKIVGVDTINIDDSYDLKRPAHSKLLKAGILICENLRNLSALYSTYFTFYALPIKARKVAAMPVRAFAEVY